MNNAEVNVNTCAACGVLTVLERVNEYKAEIGIPVVLINCVEVARCAECKRSSSVLIPNPPGLVAAAAVARIQHPAKLNGRDIRFLRKARMLKAKQLAEELDVTEETISRWENDKMVIGSAVEKWFRFKTWAHLHRQAPRVRVKPSELLDMKINSVRDCNDVVQIWLTTEETTASNKGKNPRYTHAKAA